MSQFRNLKRALSMLFIPFPFVPLADHGHLTTTLGAGVLTLNTPQDAAEILAQATAQNIRYTLDGTPPTAASGFQMVAGDPPIRIPVVGGRTTITFIREANGAILELQYGE